jgi:putative endonuclease
LLACRILGGGRGCRKSERCDLFTLAEPNAASWVLHARAVEGVGMRSLVARSARQRIGDAAEQAACAMLQRAGLRVVSRQVVYRVGELDIVARDGPALVFVEVRSRARAGLAAASVDAAKRRRLRRAAQQYLQQHFGDRWPPCRFDVVIAEADRLEWLRAAFGAEEEGG